MESFIKILDESPLILCSQDLDGHLAVGTHQQIAGLLVTIQGDVCITDGAYQFVCHNYFLI